MLRLALTIGLLVLGLLNAGAVAWMRLLPQGSNLGVTILMGKPLGEEPGQVVPSDGFREDVAGRYIAMFRQQRLAARLVSDLLIIDGFLCGIVMIFVCPPIRLFKRKENPGHTEPPPVET